MPYLLLLALALLPALASAQTDPDDLIGAWASEFTDNQGRDCQLTMTIADGFMVMTAYHAASGEFLSTLGGPYRADYATFGLTYEFNTTDSNAVGGAIAMPYRLIGRRVLIFNDDKLWTRVDDGQPGSLAGAWEIIGRKRDGRMRDLTARRDGPRKTMKILSGTRFQWIAFDTEKKQFRGTGGGSYETNDDGLYIEKIEFFSRDPSRTGQQLSFDYRLFNGQWIHRGQSSKGKPIHEVWGRRGK